MAASGEDVYCTLVMNDAYLPGAAVLAHSLRDGGTKKKLAVMLTLETLSADAITELKNLYDILIPVERVVNPNPGNIYLMDRGDLLYTFTKINLWRQTQFRKIVYVDSDIVALRALDELFDIDAPFAAAPDIGWPDCFNSGLMVLSPNMGDFWALQTLANSGESFDGADQGLLNQYFEHRGWHRLSFTYNCTPNAEYQWEPAYRHYKSSIKAVHFIGKEKPWFKGRQKSRQGGIYGDLVNQWWAVYDRHYKNQFFDASRPYASQTRIIQKNVTGEAHDEFYGVPQEQRIAPPAITDVAPATVPTSSIRPIEPKPQVVFADSEPQQHQHSHSEQPFSSPEPRAEALEQGRIQPTPTVQQRKFSAPQLEWDATRAAPPMESRPEAANFPHVNYEFSESKHLYHPPTSYPEPPKDMWYEVPQEKPHREATPPPIFPWEREREKVKPTRRFAEDEPPPPPPAPREKKRPTGLELPSAPSIAVGDDTFTPFSPQANAWDANPSIERYVRAVFEAQNPHKARKAIPESSDIVSPTGSGPSQRRESLILTDFPSADDRPSLPVTPAPIRRPTFWGEERDEQGELPAAEGVPDQAEWNPSQQLEELRRNSLLEVSHLQSQPEGISGRRLSLRDMPAHAAPLPNKPAGSPTATRLDGLREGKTGSDGEGFFGSVAATGSTVTGESLTTVPEEPSSTESSRDLGGDGANDSDVVSPRTAQHAPSVETLEASLSGHATSTGKPMFSEPDFAAGPVQEARPGWVERKSSEGAFSAEKLEMAEAVSPTER